MFIGKDGLSLFNREFFNYDRIKIPSPVSLVNDKENKFIYVSTSSSGIYKMDYNFNVLENFKTDPLNPLVYPRIHFLNLIDRMILKF